MRETILYKESPWIKCDLNVWKPIMEGRTPSFYERGTVIYHQNFPREQVFLVKAGRVNLSIVNPDGEERCLFVADEGCLFGEVVQYGIPSNCAQATTVTDSHVYAIPNSEFSHAITDDPRLSLSVIRMLAKKVRLLTGQLELMSFHDSAFQVEETMHYLAEQYGVLTEDGILIDMRFTHQELANLVGVSRVTITNVLSQMKEKGKIRRVKSKYLVRTESD